MSKRKASEEWNTVVKILEKPNVSNRLLEYLYHPDARIQKLADKSVHNYKNETKSQAVIKFWEDIEKRKLGNKLFSLHFNGFAELVKDRLQDVLVENRNDSIPKSKDDNQDELYTEGFNSDEEQSEEEEYFADIIDLDNATEQKRPPFFTVEEWLKIISESQSPSIKLPKSVEEQFDCYLKETNIEKIRESFESYKKVTSEEDRYTRKNRPGYFAQRPGTESTFRVRFIEPIIEPFIFIFKNMDITWGEISSVPSANRRNLHLEEGKRRRIGSKADGIGSLVNLDDKELLIFELSGAPSRLPKRHAEGDKVKLERCMIDVPNDHLEDYKMCDIEVAKKLRVFGFQTDEKYNCTISTAYIVGRGLYCKKTFFQFSLPRRVLDLCYLYDIIEVMLSFRNELSNVLNVIQKLKIAKTYKLLSDNPLSGYMLRLPPT
ncbi:15370_t:CDS:2 [Entrophospora sp. SA101]|nr:15370_t:CDS:2 [Entrophospora sp. SA101]CAJ0833844.1 17495_t:CDS:2 [Entrophospora sp. SA101]